MIQNWEDVKKLDDCITDEEKKIIDNIRDSGSLDKEATCPYLGCDGDYFLFCKKNMSKEDLNDKKISPFNKKYQAHVSATQLGIDCTENFKNCCVYKGLLKK